MSGFGGGFAHGLGIDDATTGRGSGEYGKVEGINFGDYTTKASQAARNKHSAASSVYPIFTAIFIVAAVLAMIFIKEI